MKNISAKRKLVASIARTTSFPGAQIAVRLGKPEEEVKSLIATLIKDKFLERNNYRGQDYWELVY